MTRVIAHRGLIDGPDKKLENTVEQIELALQKGYDVEFDVRSDRLNNFYLGHDSPEHCVSYDWISNLEYRFPGTEVWVHCKTVETLIKVSQLNRGTIEKNQMKYDFHFFYHDKDDVALTNTTASWIYPGKEPNIYDFVTSKEGTIVVLPELRMEVSEFKDHYNENFLRSLLKKKEDTQQYVASGYKSDLEVPRSVTTPYGICTDYARLLRKALN